MIQQQRPAETIGWTVGRDVEDDALRAALRLGAMAEGHGTSLPFFPAAQSFLSEFYGLGHRPTEPGGRDVASSGFSLDPEKARFQLVQLSRLSAGLRLGLFPAGVMDNGSVLAVADEGQLLSFGLGGGWQVGDSGLEGIENLISGSAPRRLRASEQTWDVRPATDGGPVVGAVQAVLTAVYVLHHHGIYSARELRLTVTGLRGSGVEIARRSIRLPRGRLEETLTPITREVDEVLAAHSGGAGCEVKLAVEPGSAQAEKPAGLVRFSVRFGHAAMRADGLEAGLRVGGGAQTGSLRGRVEDAQRSLRQRA